MPGFDQTGPVGRGPRTGLGLGPCGRGYRRGLGLGYGRYTGRNYLSQNEELEVLEEEAKNLEADLKVIKETISEIKTR